MSGALPLAPPAVASEIERRLNWRVFPLACFVLMMVSLTVLASLQLASRPATLTGLPDSREIRLAGTFAYGRLLDSTGPLRFRSALLGDGAIGAPALKETRDAARRVGEMLNAVPKTSRADPRFVSARASLALVSGRRREAERLYRAALDRAPAYGEAHLGLGAALALRADAERSHRLQRSLRLAALAHFVAVAPGDPAYEAALYDRVVMLRAVGREEEARRVAGAYALHDATSPWALRLAQEFAATP